MSIFLFGSFFSFISSLYYGIGMVYIYIYGPDYIDGISEQTTVVADNLDK